MDTEQTVSCDADYVALYDGDSLSSPLINRFCGEPTIASSIRSKGNSMLVNFVSDYAIAGNGFKAVYRATYGKIMRIHLIVLFRFEDDMLYL